MTPERWSAVSINSSKRTGRLHFDQFNVYRLLRYLLWLEPVPRSIELSNQQNRLLREDDANFSSYMRVRTWATTKLHWFWVLSSSHCTVNESSSGFTTPTAARWSFLQSLQIPVNRSALSLGDVQLITCISFPWTSFSSNYFHLTSMENNAFAYDDLFFPF